jgi:RimJ/RimL family protein N-acetyltransferase
MLPRFETERLVVRAPVIEDFAAYREILMSPRAVYMSEEPLDRRQTWLDFTQVIATWMLRGHGLFTIANKATGDVLGFTLIGMESDDLEPELGWFLVEGAEGKGYALEAARAVRRWGIETLELPALVSYIDPPNARSIRLAERLGGWHDPVASEVLSRTQNADVLVYRHWPPMADDGGMEAYA